MCLNGLETVLHLLRDCHASNEALFLAGMPRALVHSHAKSTVAWLEETTTLLFVNSLVLILIVLWNLWNQRNAWGTSHAVGYIKVNAGVAYDSDCNTTAIEVITRDECGSVLGG
ncbi:hypothetical protein V6N13_110809 [Hibiscus sabdariffa]|uniref:Uncharacterized protein n=1 Tax=Hibiscus sabdariffa TaxID=183260 RepID=A0ABR2TJ35_9ROSI